MIKHIIADHYRSALHTGDNNYERRIQKTFNPSRSLCLAKHENDLVKISDFQEENSIHQAWKSFTI